MKKFKFFIPYLIRMKWMILLIFILTFAISIITLILPYLSKLLFDQGIMPKNINLIIKFGLLLILAHFIKASLNLASNVSFTITSNRFIARVKEDLFNRILKMPMAFFDNKQSGYVLARINEIGSLTAMFSPVIFQFFSSLMSFVGAFIVMFSISRKVMMVAILFLPFFYYLTRKTSGHLRKSSKDLLETSANASGVFQESIAGISEIKELNIENIKSAEIKKHIQTIAKKSIHRGKFMNLGMELITFLTNTSTAVLSIVIGVLVARDELSIGDYVALIQYAGMLYLPILLLSTFSITIQPGLVALSRLSSIFEMNSEEETKGKIKLDCIENIRFEDVHFTYPTADKEALKGISFEIKKGDKIALLGPNGSGKSTIAKLILGFYTNYDGKICINDTELKEINIGSLRKKIGIVSQNVFLFSGTILDNIKMANPQVDNEKLMLALKMSSCDELLSQPAFDKLYVKETGKNISKGEKQKIAIARAIIKDADLLIFDEATSHLDEGTKEIVKNVLSTSFNDKTCIIITHDKEIAAVTEKILKISEGNIKN